MKSKLWGIALAAVIFSGCAGSADRTENAAETVSETREIKVSSNTTVSETTAAKNASDTEAADESEPEYVGVSEGNEFIDFEFIENYQGTTDIGDLADKAVEFLKTTEYYSDSIKNISEFTDGEFSDYIADGVIVPKFNIAYPNDYDGNGSSETFIVVDMPYYWGNFRPVIRNILIFADSGGTMEVIGDYSYFKPERYLALLNYGKYKQIIFGGDGTCGADMHTVLYGVKSGKAVEHFGVRGGFKKENCFLTATDYYGGDCFMYFDTAENEYRCIVGVPVSIDEMKVLDGESFFAEYYRLFNEEGFIYFERVSKNYYRVYRDLLTSAAVFKYEDGKFTKINGSGISSATRNGSLKSVIDIDIDKAISEMKPPQEPYAKVSEDNVFIDYKFIEDYQGRTDIGVLAASAVDFLTESEYYAETTENIGKFSGDEFKKYFDEGGNILPRLRTAYPEDYDGDGSTETFIIVDMPYMIGTPTERSFLIYADSRGEMTVLSDASNLYDTVMLDYGDFKQITFGGCGTVGADDHTELYGVVNGEAKNLYGFRGEFYKKDCFLSVFGAQGAGAFMYYDTVACEYRAIAGEDIPIEKIKEMDTANALSEFYEWLDEHGQLYAELIGGRYYVIIRGAMDTGTAYLYEDGEFIQTDDCKYVRDSHYSDIDNIVLDIDITKAIAEMKPPAEPYAKVSEDNVFIDYKFIEDYQGTTDIGVLANKAVEFLMTAEEYSESMRNTEKFTDEKFTPYIKDGKIVPQFNIAYPEDYDGDGTVETFIVADMPILQGEQPLIRSFFIFADSGGHMTLLGDESGLYGTILLDYGDFKQIIWGGFGTCGADENMCIYGVIDGQAKPLYGGRFVFRKENCFLTTHGHMSGGSFMYYDTVTNDYVPIVGVEMTLDEIKAMDKNGALSDYYEGDEYADRFFGLVGGKYYCVIYGRDITEAVFTFDGKFERVENSNVRLRFKDYYRSGEAVIDIDIDKAIAEMISVK